MKPITVKDVMTRHPQMIKPTLPVIEAAKLMKQIDCGVLPIKLSTTESDKAVGMVTDRDIILRVMAAGKDPIKTQVQDIMTKAVHCCDEDDDLIHTAKQMRVHNVSRLIVTHGGKVTGIVNLNKLLHNKDERHESDEVLHELLRHPHEQTKAVSMGTAGAGCECCEC